MKDKLKEICDVKLEYVALQKQKISTQNLLQNITGKPLAFADNLRIVGDKVGAGLICEIKKASPSKGLIRADFDVAKIANSYTKAGAACLSVLTDIPYFMGADENITFAREASNLPILRKDFMLDEYQIIESRSLGADCILLIVAALEITQMKDLADTARDFGLDILVEIHNMVELETMLENINPDIIGINNRNLKTMQIDLTNTENLASYIPDNYLKLCESGIRNKADINRIKSAGINNFLIGESLMRADNIENAVQELLN